LPDPVIADFGRLFQILALFFESHHIVWLFKGGDDTIENSTALCPNCHRKMQSLNLKSVKKNTQRKGHTGLILFGNELSI
jgi:hypothetical protein